MGWRQNNGGRFGNQPQGGGFMNNENEGPDQGPNRYPNSEVPRGQGQNQGRPNQGRPNQGRPYQGRPNGNPNEFEQPRRPSRQPVNEFEGGARGGQCSQQDFQRTLQAACRDYQNGAAAAQAVQPAAYFHFSTGRAGQASRDRPVQFENADFIEGFTQNRGMFNVPYDGVYEFGVSLRLDRRTDAPLYMYVRVNNEDKLRCVALSDMSNCHGMIKARKGDRVFVRTERNGHYGNNRDSYLYSFFEGRLVHQDAPMGGMGGSPRGASINTEVPRQGGRGRGQQYPSVEEPRRNGRLG